MTRLISLILFACFITCVYAHDINKYKYFCLDVHDNPYDIEKRLKTEFRKHGFFVIGNEFYDNLDAHEKALTLFAEYDYYINYHGPSTLTISLKTANGRQVWSASGEGDTFLSAKGDMKGATKQIMSQFSRLKYRFDEDLVKISSFKHPKANWSEDSIKQYLRTKPLSSPEGIYKNYSNNGDSFRIAVLKHADKYYGIIIDADNDLWAKGDIKLVLTSIENGLYDAEFYDDSHQKLNAMAALNDNRILSFTVPYNGQNINFSIIKTYPTSNNFTSANGTLNNKCVATGSGVLLSDNIIITNNHVIDGANKIEVVLDMEGIPEAFNAKVLCTDKTNDLAIICIKDNQYIPKGLAPFNIIKDNVDVETQVYAMGFPVSDILGEEMKVTDGIVSAKSGYEGDIVYYQISAPITNGNSGGPLFDIKGNLIGITSFGIKNKGIAENVGYAIKSPYIFNLIDSAPIDIKLPKSQIQNQKKLTDLVKILRPYVAYIKIY